MVQFMSQRPVTEVPQEDEGWGVLGWGLEGRKAGLARQRMVEPGPWGRREFEGSKVFYPVFRGTLSGYHFTSACSAMIDCLRALDN